MAATKKTTAKKKTAPKKDFNFVVMDGLNVNGKKIQSQLNKQKKSLAKQAEKNPIYSTLVDSIPQIVSDEEKAADRTLLIKRLDDIQDRAKRQLVLSSISAIVNGVKKV